MLVVSAHWLTKGTFVSCASHPKQTCDFYGFPEELHAVRYTAAGSPTAAERVVGLGSVFPVRCSDDWGLDHASWAILVHLFPDADIPVLELSLDVTRSEPDHLRLARELSSLRDEGLLIIGSGNIVHNLEAMTSETDASCHWAMLFDEAVAEAITGGEHDRLASFRKAFPEARRAVPTNDHYLPMLYAIAQQQPGEQVTFTHTSMQHGSISMRCFRIG